jgi:hypothetical protein
MPERMPSRRQREESREKGKSFASQEEDTQKGMDLQTFIFRVAIPPSAEN